MGLRYYLALEMYRILELSPTQRKFLCSSLTIKTSIIGTFIALSNFCSYLDINIITSIEQQMLLLSPIEMIRAFANHGKEISLELIGNTINAVMKVYAPNTTTIKSTSFPNGFTVNRSGMEEIKTTIRGNSTQNVIAVVQFTDLSKTMPISNPLQVDLNLTRGLGQASALEEEPSYEIAALPP